jgi:hypothetical protein
VETLRVVFFRPAFAVRKFPLATRPSFFVDLARDPEVQEELLNLFQKIKTGVREPDRPTVLLAALHASVRGEQPTEVSTRHLLASAHHGIGDLMFLID